MAKIELGARGDPLSSPLASPSAGAATVPGFLLGTERGW